MSKTKIKVQAPAREPHKKEAPKKETVIHERDINKAKPAHLQRTYAIKKYSRKGRTYAAQGILSLEDAKAELARLAGKILLKHDNLQQAPDGMSFTVDEGKQENVSKKMVHVPLLCEYKIL